MWLRDTHEGPDDFWRLIRSRNSWLYLFSSFFSLLFIVTLHLYIKEKELRNEVFRKILSNWDSNWCLHCLLSTYWKKKDIKEFKRGRVKIERARKGRVQDRTTVIIPDKSCWASTFLYAIFCIQVKLSTSITLCIYAIITNR